MIVQVETTRCAASSPRTRSLRVAAGLALAGAAAAVALGVHAAVDGLPVVAVAVALGVILANLQLISPAARPGLAVASGSMLKAGIVLLGFELVFQEMLRLGARGLIVVAAVVIATFVGTRLAGRLLGVSEGLSLLVATGFAICGVSAIAAAREVVDVDEEDVAYAVALVTLCGSLAIVLLPSLRSVLGLDDPAFGAWVGASVHDVGQVVATSSVVGGAAVSTAIVVKLARVMLLGPVVAWIGWRHGTGSGDARGRVVPGFLLAFLAAGLLRSLGLVPHGLLPLLADVKVFVLAMALFAVGARVELRKLAVVGPRPLALALGSWVIVAAIAYAGVEAVWV
ncbi:MAG TPA: putative sulfate exporter family transporter [Gaiellaceae bacterium]|nr:putative sulfate exporter family transporter [Gaiellaceae bacterium]